MHSSCAFPIFRIPPSHQQQCIHSYSHLSNSYIKHSRSRITALSETHDAASIEQPPSTFKRLIARRTGTSFTDVAEIEIVPMLVPKEGEVLVKVAYAGINGGCETFRARGEHAFSGNRTAQFFTLGAEGAGTVVSIGAGVSNLHPGQHVTFIGGAFSEYVVAKAALCWPVPSPTPEAVALTISGTVANAALKYVGNMKTGDIVLVTAAAGATGSFAVQIAQAAGCAVIATCGNEKKAERLRALGLERVINYRVEDVASVLKKENYTGNIDIAYEGVGGGLQATAWQALCRPGGRLLSLGYISEYPHVDTTTRQQKEQEQQHGSDLPPSAELFWSGKFHQSPDGRVAYGKVWPTDRSDTLKAKQELFDMYYTGGKIDAWVDQERKFSTLEAVPEAVDYMLSGRACGRYSHEITYEELSQHFHLPTEKACQKLGVGLTILKRICRRFGLPRWPYRKPSKLVYSANPIAYSRPEQQQASGYAPTSNATATAAADDHHQPPHHLADTPAANYLRHQAMHEPSPFNSGPFPTSWQVPSELPQKQHLESLGCSRPIPRRLVANSREKSVPEATLRAIGLSNNHNANSHDEAQTDRLDVLISAIAQSENVGGFEEWRGDDMNGSLPQPNSPASVNTLQGSLQGSPTASAGAPPPPLVHPSLHYVASSHGINEDGPIIMEPAANPVFLHAKPAPAAPPITTTANVSTATAASGMGTLSDALAQLANNTGYNAPSGSHSSASTLQSLVKLLAAHPELAGQLQRVLNQPKESSAFAENLHAGYNHQQQYQQQPPPPPPPQQQQQQQDASHYMQEHPAAPSNEQDLLVHLLQRQQQLQKMAKAVDLEGGGANATAAAAALRRAQLSVKFQAMQAKLAARQAALQKLQNSVDFQSALAGQQQQQEQRKQSPILTTATPPLTAVAAPTMAISIAAGNNGNPTFSGDISTNGAAAAAAAATTIPGITNAPASLAAAQEDRRELYRLLAAKLQQQQQQQH